MLLTFSEWVDNLNEGTVEWVDDLNEGAVNEVRRGPAPGAFGNQRKQNYGGYSHSREDQRNLQGNNDRTTYKAQIAFGKEQEKKIFAAAVQSCKLKVSPASPNEDMQDNIDGYWWPNGGQQKVPFSMKYRDTGPDLLFEVIKPYVTEPILDPQNKLGRDVKPKNGPANSFNPRPGRGPKYIFLLSREGNKLSIIEADPCYEIIGYMLHEVNDKGWNQGKAHITSKGTLRLQKDGSTQVPKVMAYLPLTVAKPIFQCDVNITIE